LSVEIDSYKGQFDLMTEEKRLRQEKEDAIAAQKAKENEYNDVKIAVDEAKANKDKLVSEGKKLRKEADACDRTKTPNDCDAKENAATAKELEVEVAKAAYQTSNKTFKSINEELRIKQEEATARQLANQRTQVFNMVNKDTTLVKDI
jgi:hypothetical protein